MPKIPMLPQFYIGEGVNSTSGKVFGQAIDFASVQSLNTGQVIELELKSISSSRELTEGLQIDVSASLKLGGWGASAEFKLANSVAVNSYYTYALVRVLVQNSPKVLRDPKLRKAAQDLLRREGWVGFSAAYGWEYIQGVIEGGSYYGLIEIQTTDEKKQREVNAKLSGSFGPFKADAAFETALLDAIKNTTTNVIVFQSGGSGDPVETDLESMIEQARNFPQLIKDSPVTIAALVADYRSTVPLPSGVPAPDSLPMIQQKNTLEDLGRRYSELRDYKRSLEFILEQQRLSDFDDFRDFDQAQLDAKKAEYRASLQATATELDKIAAQAQKCAEDYKLCQTYVPSVQRLPLPRKGGELMNLKEMEEKLAVLEERLGRSTALAQQQLTDLIYGRVAFNELVLSGGQRLNSPGRLHISGEELLYLLNKKGVIIGKAWGGNGNLVIEGDLVVDGRIGSRGHPSEPKTKGWGGGLHTWDIEAEGTVWSARGYQSGPRDIAENYFSDLDLEPGDVVCFNEGHDGIVRSKLANNKSVLGVISTEPGFLLGSTHGVESDESRKAFPVALAGCVPCKVSAENGAICQGDILTSSSTPGHAMKAKPFLIEEQEYYTPGTIIGKALGSMNSGVGVVEALVFLR